MLCNFDGGVCCVNGLFVLVGVMVFEGCGNEVICVV